MGDGQRIDAIAEATGLRFCDDDCDCGECSELWHFPVPGDNRDRVPSWVPGWMNAAGTEEIWRWLVEHGRVATDQPLNAD